jgi:small subunit ribosomal protein S6
MRQYEVTFIIDPVLPNEEIEGVAKTYQDQLVQEGCSIIHVDAMGLRQLAYPINKRTSGIYFCLEFTSPSHDIIEKFELSLRRDERIMRFLTVKLDKYGVKYNLDKRNGLIGKVKRGEKKRKTDEELEEEARAAEFARPPRPTTSPVGKEVVAPPVAKTIEPPEVETSEEE